MLKTKILCLLFPLILLAEISSSPDNSAGFIEKTFDFEESLLTLKKVNGYDMVCIPDAPPLVKPGYPSLPQIGLKFVIPPNATAKAVEIIVNHRKVIPGEFNILPAQPPMILSETGVKYAFAEPSPEAYTSKKPYPENLASEPHTGTKCGYRIADFCFYPIQYIPAKKKLTLIKNFTVRLYYDYGKIPIKEITPMQKYTFGNSVRKMVMNPEEVENWAPEVKNLSSEGDKERLQSPGAWDMVIISPDNANWINELQVLADWKTRKGVSCRVKNVQEIYDDENYHNVDDAAEIKNYIIDAANHGTIWVLFGADAGTNASNSIPYRGVYAFYQWGLDGHMTFDMPCERYYEDLQEWDYDHDGIWGESLTGWYADVYVGRMCANNYLDARKHVQRILKYERDPEPNYTRKALFYSSRLAQIISEHFNGLMITRECEYEVPNDWFVAGDPWSPPGFHYMEYVDPGTYNDYPGDNAIIDSMNSGYGFVCEATLGNKDKILAWLGGGEPPPTTTTTTSGDGGTVEVCFTNDAGFRDLFIEQVTVDGEVRGVDDWLMTNGCRQYGQANSSVTIMARGSSGEENMRLKIGGATVANWTVSTTSQNYSYTIGGSTGYTKIMSPLYSEPTPNNISISTSDIDGGLNPGFKVGIHTGLGCAAGAFDDDCIAEHIYDKGAIGGAWNSRETVIEFGGSSWLLSYSPRVIKEFFEAAFDNSTYHLGQAVAEAKDELIWSYSAGDAWDWSIKTYNTFGDPELPMWTGEDEPGVLTAEYVSVLPSDPGLLNVTVESSGNPVSNACVCCVQKPYQFNTKTMWTDANGEATLDLSSFGDIGEEPIQLYVTVTKHNYIPYYAEETITLIPPYLELMGIEVPIGGSRDYKAVGAIYVANPYEPFIIHGDGNNGGNVTMEAGGPINLYPGFEAQEGCEFHAFINTSFATSSKEIKGSAVPLSYDSEEKKPLKVLTESVASGEKSITQTLTSPDKEKEPIPTVFSCAQNLPNPFVRNTTINYGLPKDSDVNLTVFNLAGQAVKTLISEQQSAGFKSVNWDGSSNSGAQVPQGIYFYVFRAGEFEEHKKMILVK